MKTLACLFGLLLAAQFAAAQAPQSRERELLRRAQAALRDVTAERDALRAAEAALKAQLSEAEAARDRARAEVAALSASLRQAQAERDALQGSLQAEREQAARLQAGQQAAAVAREAAWQQDIAALRSTLEERTLANRSLSALLERANEALRDAERRNAELHAMGLILIERWRHKSAAEAWLHEEPVVGVAGVRAEDQAEQWRLKLDALRRPAPR